MNIKVLGSGCQNCKRLYENAKEAVFVLKIEAEIDYVTDFMEISKYNLMRTPGLVINQKVVSYGKVCTKEEIIELIQKSI
ncbi:MAG: thioredoxin family protein [Vulcanibacillus sp.]|nr:thioredoxin family protein [Acholeplasmataceae bacterium]MDD4194100.1 thioredoxin family protein [Acholeplasmataceae bacterium]